MPETELDKEELYNLSDLDVTVGIVSRGAVSAFAEKGVNFFLLKSEDGMTEPIVIEESPDLSEASPSLWSKITQTIKAEIAKAIGKPPMDDEEAEEEMMAEEELEDDEEDTEKGRVSSGGGKPKKKDGPKGKDKMSKEQTEAAPQTDAQADLTVSLIKAQFEALQQAHKAEMQEVIKSAREEVEKAHQEQITSLLEKVEKAETERAQAEDARVKREFIEKAMNFRTLSVGHTQLGELLYKAYKALDSDTYGQIEAILKAADNQLGAAGIFGEFGTARTPEEVTLEEKVQKAAADGNKSYADALLSLSEADQLELLKSMRGGK